LGYVHGNIVRISNKTVGANRACINTSLFNIFLVVKPVIRILVILGHVGFLVIQFLASFFTRITIVRIHSTFSTIFVTSFTFSVRNIVAV
jgi:hypothetical protein